MSRLLWVCMVLVTLMMLAAQWMGMEELSWSRPRLHKGEYWRFLTGHWVHLNIRHLSLNVAGLWLLAFLFSQELDWKRWGLALLLLPCLLSVMLWYLLPDLEGYAGLSGVLHGVFVMGIATLIRVPEERVSGVLMLLLLLLKLWLERHGAEAGPTAQFIGGRVLVESHRFGALAGLILAVLAWFWPAGKHSSIA